MSDRLTAALVVLARYGISPDIQELLMFGDAMRGIPPGALKAALSVESTPAPVRAEGEATDKRLLLAAKILLQHVENSPEAIDAGGWLADCRKDIESAAIKAALEPPSPKPDAEGKPEQLDWKVQPGSSRWKAPSKIGTVTIALKRAGKNMGLAWIATLEDGRRIASADTSLECRSLAEYHVERLAREAVRAEGEAIECHGLDTPERVCFYEQDFYVLSNFSSFSLRMWGGIRFDTSEAAYHWAKFDLEIPACREVQNNIYHSRSAHDAFKIAETHKRLRRPDWDDVKVDIMRDILRAKANQHEYVRRKLLATGDRELVENSWRDDFWGWGPNRDGKNMLGKLWMEVRAELRAALKAEDSLHG